MSHEGFARLGIDSFPVPYVGRCVLLVRRAPARRRDCCRPATASTAEDLAEAEKAAGTTVRPGDAALVGTGWSRLWDRDDFVGATRRRTGPRRKRGHLARPSGVRLAGGETIIAFEQINAPAPATRSCRSTGCSWSTTPSTSSKRCGSPNCSTPASPNSSSCSHP
ncbi:cyclase family protein [Yinghuangia aomiensis]